MYYTKFGFAHTTFAVDVAEALSRKKKSVRLWRTSSTKKRSIIPPRLGSVSILHFDVRC